MFEAVEKDEALEKILNGIWQLLQRGVARFNDPFHEPVLATAGSDGSSLRTVILRQFNKAERLLVCHTDSRADKVKQISDYARVCWLFYHPKNKIQLRISGPPWIILLRDCRIFYSAKHRLSLKLKPAAEILRQLPVESNLWIGCS
jgi:pyridoxine/pyridoxamine 5'-phosphate oxidase